MQGTLRVLVAVLAAILALALVIFGVQNTQPVNISFLGFTSNGLPLSLVITGAAISGAAVIGLLDLFSAAQRTIRRRRESKERTQLEAQVGELSNERDNSTSRIEALTIERDQLEGQLNEVSAQRDELAARTEELMRRIEHTERAAPIFDAERQIETTGDPSDNNPATHER
jgi:uncharacterized integral membrane protein